MTMTTVLFWAGLVIAFIGFGIALMAFLFRSAVLASTGVVMMIAGLLAIIASAPYVAA